MIYRFPLYLLKSHMNMHIRCTLLNGSVSMGNDSPIRSMVIDFDMRKLYILISDSKTLKF